MVRTVSVQRYQARVRQSRRRHLLPLGSARDSLRGGREGADHLQDPIQRRGGDDRRPASRWPAHAGDDQPPGCGRRGRQDRRCHRPARALSDGEGSRARHTGASSRRARCGTARAARVPRRVGAHLRPDLRGGKTASAQARRVSRPGPAHLHQRSGVRGLRRLRRSVQLRVGGTARNRVRPQAHDQPVELQQGFLVREGLLPQLRERSGWEAEKRQGTRLEHRRFRCAARTHATNGGGALRHSGDGYRRHRRSHDRAAPGHGGAPGGQGLHRARHGRPCAKEWRGALAHPHRRLTRSVARRARGGRTGRCRDRLRHRGRDQH